jgi:hypothetical protein
MPQCTSATFSRVERAGPGERHARLDRPPPSIDRWTADGPAPLDTHSREAYVEAPVSAGWEALTAIVLLLTLPISAEAGWVLLAPDPRGSFESALACSAETAAWQARARDGARWVVGQYQHALQQDDQAVITFWRQAVHRAAGQIEQARNARCVEVKS